MNARLLLIFILIAASMSLARAHAFLDHAEPRVGSTVEAPTRVEIWMTKGVRAPYSTVQVLDAKGGEVDKRGAVIEDATMTVALPKLAPGTYTVKWRAESQDCGHKTSGTFTFAVK